jgi:glycosyltransferase involved in cell wall biosynthesis
MRLSVSMIVKNEESCLAAALQSIQGVDELIVVDTGSTDKTKEIAASFGAVLHDFPWIDDFAAARNESLKHCTGDWILILDADEILEPGGLEKVRAAIESAPPDTLAIGVKVNSKKTYFMSPRIFKRCPEVYWKGEAHNYLSVNSSIPSDVVIHFGYSEAHKLDPDRTLRILTKVLNKNPKAVREAYYLAREYWTRLDYATAAKWYADYLTRATWAPEMADAWMMLAYCLWNLQQGEEARDACLQAIKINTNFKEAIKLMATMSGPKNRTRWLEFAETASNELVLFVRNENQ